jgi:DNA-directed RNA polymerase specialized sigma24 family protein
LPRSRRSAASSPGTSSSGCWGSGKYRAALVEQAALLLDGDAAAADEVVRASFADLEEAWNQLGDPPQPRLRLYRTVFDRAKSVRRNRSAPQAAPTGLLALPERQREAVVLRNYMGLSERQAAAAMRISTRAVRSHLARGMLSLRHLPGT